MFPQSIAQGSRHSVLVAHPVSDAAMDRLQTFFDVETRIAKEVPSGDDLVDWLQGKAGIMVDTRFVFDAPLVRRLPTLKAICNLDAGHGNLDLEALTRAGIRATSTPEPGSIQLATEAAVDGAWREITRWLANASPTSGEDGRYSARWSRRVLLAEPVNAARLGIVGAGSFAQALVLRAQADRLQVLNAAADAGNFWRSADAVVLAAGEDAFPVCITAADMSLMKPGACVFNFSGEKAVAADILSDTRLRGRIVNCDPAAGHGLAASGEAMLNRTLVAAEDLIASLGFGRNSWHPQHLLNPDILCDSCC
ncbi:MAG: hypothetical protein V4451_06175 [Pseudomonadota bacterium]